MNEGPDSAGRVRQPSRRPSPARSAFLHRLEAYDVVHGGPGTHRGLPSTALIMVLPVGDPIDVGWLRSVGSRGARWSCVAGLHCQPAEVFHSGRQAGIELSLTLRGARALLGFPSGELSGVMTELGEVAPALADLPGRLAEAATWPERLAMVERRLRACLATTPEVEPRPEISWALQRLSRPATVGTVAAEVGMSRRRLGDLFRAEYGVTPKQFQRIARFEASHRALVRQARVGRPVLAAIAAECGFADQAHMTREWTALAGCTPTAWLRAEFPFVQATTDEARIT